MALQFVLGSSGSGKSTYVFEQIIKRSIEEEKQNFFILVPDQFTMQTQMDLVTRHPRGGIMNIDVLSFGRLSYRIMEETGGSRIPVLDDTGKSLVLRKVAEEVREQLPVLGSHLKKLGYIHQVKSALSEFMQYGIGEDELNRMLAFSEKRGSLYGKLMDLKVLHKAFHTYLSDRFITTEETYDRLARQLEDSRLIKDSVVVLDGFTGFTPIQNRVIEQLLRLAKEVIVTLTLEPGERVQLFSLSLKTKASLENLARTVKEEIKAPLWIDAGQGRFKDNPVLAHLEKQLFGVPQRAFEKEADAISLFETRTMEEEVRQVCHRIRERLRAGYCYRDIAVISGDLEAYGSLIEEIFKQYELPYFMDKTRGITLNPFIEYIRSALQVIISGYSYEAMFHYLRSGMAEIEKEAADKLENYVLRFGIKGKKTWNSLFVRTPGGERQMEELEEINRVRQQIVERLSLLKPGRHKVEELVKQLYTLLVTARCQEKLKAYEQLFGELGDKGKEKEYAQIYRLVMDLLDQLVSLLGEEEMGWEEFAQILDAGFGEIQVGIIPQAVDQILVGDMERTRLKQVKALFFLGVNEGKIPRQTGKGGILSDLDREFLEASGQELAPTPRSQMFIQRFYLYLNLTKPSERLYLSYARLNEEGKTMRPSYIIEVLRSIFPRLSLVKEEEAGLPETKEEGRMVSAGLLAGYRSGSLKEEEHKLLCNLLGYLHNHKRQWVEELLDSAFYTYEGDRLSKQTARLLYGAVVYSSVSRLEKMASCAYAHFLRYGLGLKERQEYGFEAVDMGNVYHGVLEIFAGKLADKNYSWISFPPEEGRQLLREALEGYAINYGNTVLFSSARNAYGLEKMERILWRTVKTLQYHLQVGRFIPQSFELSFSALEDLDCVTIKLNEEEKLRLGGRIDRVDTYEKEDKLYVKVMDYKSGNRQFQLASFYHGLQLQLVIYLQAAMELEQKKHPHKEVIPGAFVYYHVDDPMVEGEEAADEEEIERRIRKELKVTGIINQDEEVLKGLDNSGEKRSLVIPVEYKTDGSLSSRSSVMDREHMQLLLDFSRKKAGELGRRIADGEISLNPCQINQMDSCSWCEFKNICNFEERVPGFEKRRLEEEDEERIWDYMRQELDEDR